MLRSSVGASKTNLLEKRFQNLCHNLSTHHYEILGPVSNIPKVRVGPPEVPSGKRTSEQCHPTFLTRIRCYLYLLDARIMTISLEVVSSCSDILLRIMKKISGS